MCRPDDFPPYPAPLAAPMSIRDPLCECEAGPDEDHAHYCPRHECECEPPDRYDDGGPDSDPTYRRDLADAGRGHLLGG